jgi:hypothetical protein
MLHEEDSSDESDGASDSIFLPGRKKAPRRPSDAQQSLDTEAIYSFPSPSHKGVVGPGGRRMTPGTSLDEDSRRESFSLNPKAEVDGGLVQGSLQGSRAGSHQGSPVPPEVGDFVVVSKG